MHILFMDESSMTPSRHSNWFVCAGAFVDAEQLPAIDAGMNVIRSKYRYGPADELKFETRSYPQHLTAAQFAQAKGEVFDLALQVGVKFIGYSIPHGVAKQQTPEFTHYLGFHTVASHFQLFLSEVNSHGIYVCDRLPFRDEQFRLLEDMQRYGGRDMTAASGRVLKPRGRFQRITMFTTTTVNGSHLASLADILLGGFRFCVEKTGSARTDACKSMFSKLYEMFWGDDTGTGRQIREKGLVIRPQNVKFFRYKEMHDALIADLQTYAGGRTIT